MLSQIAAAVFMAYKAQYILDGKKVAYLSDRLYFKRSSDLRKQVKSSRRVKAKVRIRVS
jgi:hypothetical protein